jgi:signal transduction histidine kinase
MSFRLRVALATALAVGASVWIVATVVSALVTRAFERRDAERASAAVAQFQREFEGRGRELVRRVESIAASTTVARIGAAFGEAQPDTAPFVGEAAAMAQEQSLDFLTIAGPGGAIISSSHFPARFGYREEWLVRTSNWQSVAPFLKREELADGVALGLFAVRTAMTPAGPIHIAGGLRLTQAFLDGLALPPGLSLQLWEGPLPPPGTPAPDTTRTVIPLTNRENETLGALIAMNSRRDLISLVSYLRYTAFGVGLGGVLLGVALSWWVASRVTRPVLALAENVGEVARGNWDVRADVRSKDEIGKLAADFNHMTEQLAEQKQRMVQAERVAAWRELARRLAHELKNPLFPLQLTIENLQRARARDDFDEIFKESTATLLDEMQNLKAIIGRFSDFAKMPAPQLEEVDLNELIRETSRFFAPQFEKTISIQLDLDTALPAIHADPDQLRRALRNLVLNAIDAMPRGGTLTLRTRRDGDRSVVEVADTGEGLTPEECARLFTPYYTTKTHGTGLGLAIVQSVVSDHHGSIRVESARGSGATFRVELPIHPPA